MNSRLGRRSGAAAALLLGLLVATPASPAGAAEGGPTIILDTPKAGATVTTDKVTISGRVATADLSLYRLKDVTVTVTGGSDSKKFPCSASPCPFSMDVTRASNGTYTVKAVATQVLILLGGDGPSSEVTRPVSVAAPAAVPSLDAPKVNEARNVELSWSRNPEPDMLYYAVFRKDPGAADHRRVGGDIKHPTSGTKVSFTDTGTSGLVGGDFTYQVFAVRRGATNTAELVSPPSTARTINVPVLATTSTSTAPAPGTPTSGPTTTAKPGTSGGVDLSGFLSSRSAPIAPPVITVPEPPDTGFEGTLPFGARPPSLDDMEEGEADAVPPGNGSTSIISRISPGRPLVPIAGGLVLLMLAMHMRLLNRRTRIVADGADLRVEATTVATPPPAAPPAPRPAVKIAPPPAPPPPPAPVPVPVDDEQEWAPVAGAPEPDPDPEPEPEPEPEPAALDPDAIEVFEVVSSNRRRLARAGR